MTSGPGRNAAAGWRRWLPWAGLVVGLALLAAAIVTDAGERGAITEALAAVRHPSLRRVCLLVVAVAANLVLSALMLRVLISRYGRVAAIEMQALVAASALLNFLPLRPGLFGRIAYHRAFNAIPAIATVKTVLQAAGLSVAVAVPRPGPGGLAVAGGAAVGVGGPSRAAAGDRACDPAGARVGRRGPDPLPRGHGLGAAVPPRVCPARLAD